MASLAPQDMYRVLEEHMTAEMDGDAAHAVTVYTDDVTHEVVGWPGGPVQGPDAARAFYEEFMAQFKAEHVTLLTQRSGADFLVVEHEITGTVPGVMMGVAGHGKRITLRTLHVVIFRGEKICSEQVWVDSGAVVAQLTA
jgi:predicted ester cyclase